MDESQQARSALESQNRPNPLQVREKKKLVGEKDSLIASTYTEYMRTNQGRSLKNSKPGKVRGVVEVTGKA